MGASVGSLLGCHATLSESQLLTSIYLSFLNTVKKNEVNRGRDIISDHAWPTWQEHLLSKPFSIFVPTSIYCLFMGWYVYIPIYWDIFVYSFFQYYLYVFDVCTGWNDKIVILKKTTLQLYFKTFIEKINSGNLIM